MIYRKSMLNVSTSLFVVVLYEIKKHPQVAQKISVVTNFAAQQYMSLYDNFGEKLKSSTISFFKEQLRDPIEVRISASTTG